MVGGGGEGGLSGAGGKQKKNSSLLFSSLLSSFQLQRQRLLSQRHTQPLYMPMVLGLPKAHHNKLSMKSLEMVRFPTKTFCGILQKCWDFGEEVSNDDGQIIR